MAIQQVLDGFEEISLDEKMHRLREFADALLNCDVSHSNEGPKYDFSEADDAKNGFLQYAISLIDRISNLPVTETRAGTFCADTYQAITTIASACNRIEGVLKQHPDRGSAFVSNRQSVVNKVLSKCSQFRATLLSHDDAANLYEVDGKLNQLLESSGYTSEVTEIVDRIRDAERQSKAALDAIENVVEKAVVAETKNEFATLANRHKNWQMGWAIAAGFGIVLMVAGASVALSLSLPSGTTITDSAAVSALFQKIFWLTFPAVFLRIAIGKFNLERNLYILYANRVAVLNQFDLMEKAMQGDAVHGQFALEVAKYLFSDPATGYAKIPSGNELNINPVSQITDKLLKSS